jgi:hypothetical protein
MFSPTTTADAAFFQGAQMIFDFVNDHLEELTVDADWWQNVVTPVQEEWVNAYNVWLAKDSRTKLITATKNTVRDQYEPLLSKTIDILRADIHVTAAQLRSLDIFIEQHSTHPTPTTDKVPELHIEPSIVKRITISFKPHGEDTKAKPQGVSHIEVAWDDELDVPPKKVSELKHVDLFTRSPFILKDFDDDQRGNAVYMAARYVMNADASGYGPWSTITFAIVP